MAKRKTKRPIRSHQLFGCPISVRVRNAVVLVAFSGLGCDNANVSGDPTTPVPDGSVIRDMRARDAGLVDAMGPPCEAEGQACGSTGRCKADESGDFICECHGSFTVTTTTDLVKLRGCNRISGKLTVTGPDLNSLDGLESLNTIGLSLEIHNNPSLISIAALSELRSIGDLNPAFGALAIEDNPELTHLIGLSNLRVVNNIVIRNNSALVSLEAFSALMDVSGFFLIQDNRALLTLGGLESLTTIGTGLLILGNDALQSLDGLSGLSAVDGFFHAAFNPNLSECDLETLAARIATPCSCSGNKPCDE